MENGAALGEIIVEEDTGCVVGYTRPMTQARWDEACARIRARYGAVRAAGGSEKVVTEHGLRADGISHRWG